MTRKVSATRSRSTPPQPSLLRQLLTNTRLATLLLLSGLFLLTMMALAIWGERGLIEVGRQQREVARLAHELDAVEHTNARLVRDLHRLRHDMGYIERIAREELGLARPGELVFEFVE